MSLNQERWHEVEAIYHAALERPESERARFLESACSGDDELLDEVASLLRFDERGEELLKEGPTAMTGLPPRALSPGAHLGSYEITDLIGAGGMGEVYRARDTRLDRDVAVKVLPVDLVGTPERRERFEREARAISRLSHPNICTLYDVGREDDTDFLVMEYLDGESLADRLQMGPLPLDEALSYGLQIAEALEAAHRRGVIHRDLKPGNVILTRSGAKLLDFSLAKLMAPAGVVSDPDGRSTDIVEAPDSVTRPGMLLGTLHYMSPEQLEGKPVDARSDIFAFGCLMFEMLTGRRAFDGESRASIIANILRGELPRLPRQLDGQVHPELQRAVDRCLARDPDRRWQSIADVGMLLADIRNGGDGEEPATATGRPMRAGSLAAAALAVLALILLAWFAGRLTAPEPKPAEAKVEHILLEAPELGNVEALTNLTISPDGRRVAFIGEHGGDNGIWIRDLDDVTARRLEGPDNPGYATFSADGEWIAYFDATSRAILKVSVHGGRPVTLAESGYVPFSWASDGCLYYPPRISSDDPDPDAAGLARVCRDGAAPEQLARSEEVDALGARLFYASPQLLPDGHQLLFSVGRGFLDEGWDAAVLDLDTGSWRRVLEGVNQATYFEGHLVFWRDERMWAIPFDLSRLETGGVPRPVLDGVSQHPYAPLEVGQYQVGADGSLVYVSTGSLRREHGVLERIDSNGLQEITRVQGALGSVDLSPDGRYLAAVRCLSQTRRDCRVWTYEIASDEWVAVSPAGDSSFYHPVWAGDGSSLLASKRTRDDRFEVVRLGTTPADEPGPLFSLPDPEALLAGVGSDGRVNYTLQPSTGGGDVWSVSPGGEPEAVVDDDFDTAATDMSADGRWLILESNRSGRYEIYVLDLETPGSVPNRLTKDGGRLAALAPSGNVLYWRSDSYPDASEILKAEVDLERGRIGEERSVAKLPRFNTASWWKIGKLAPTEDGVWVTTLEQPKLYGRAMLVRNWGVEIRRKLAGK